MVDSLIPTYSNWQRLQIHEFTSFFSCYLKKLQIRKYLFKLIIYSFIIQNEFPLGPKSNGGSRSGLTFLWQYTILNSIWKNNPRVTNARDEYSGSWIILGLIFVLLWGRQIWGRVGMRVNNAPSQKKNFCPRNFNIDALLNNIYQNHALIHYDQTHIYSI